MTTKTISAENYSKVFVNPEVRFLGSDSSDSWFLKDGNLFCLTSDCDGNFTIMDFEVSLEELREKDGGFWLACFTDCDVNHSLDAKGMAPFDNVRQIVGFFNNDTNTPPITSCGMTNYVCEWLHQECIDLDTHMDRSDVIRHITEQLSKMGMDFCDAQSIAESLADEVKNDAEETCGEQCMGGDYVIAFHRALLHHCGREE